MSNSAVGQTYDNIIEETLKTSRADFLDAGIPIDYLETLRTLWQTKLTASKVALFPWATSPPRNEPPLPAVPARHQPHDPSPSTETTPQAQTPHYHNPAMAALRAMQQVQHHAAQQQGDSNGAAAVVSQLAAIAKQQDEQFKAEQEMRKLKEEEERGLQMMDVKREDDLFGDVEMDGYNSSYAGSKRDISQVDSPEEPLRPAPSFVAGSLMANTPPVDVEDDDLDAPHDPDSPTFDPTATTATATSHNHIITPQSHTKKPKKEIDPLDDAINSDLDDSDIDSDLDSEFGEGDEDDGTGGDKSIVLCMYEKVHRTKNKWKCQLKDGVISIQGKDWVFSRANGEFEW